MARLDGVIAERARRQLGLITLPQLDRLGCTRAHRRILLRDGWLHPESRAVYRVGGGPFDWRTDVLAAVWSTGAGSVASHRTAARLWGFDGPAEEWTELTIPTERRSHYPAAIIHRSGALASRDVTRLGPIPITTRIRTLVDMAGICEPDDAEAAIDGALRDRVVTHAALVRRAVELTGHGRSDPGIALRLLAVDGARTESWLEKRFVRITAEAGLPRPEVQRRVGRGTAAARLDFTYPDKRLVVEVDGHRTHSARRQRQADAEREARLVANGWRVIRFTYEDVVERPDYVVRTVGRLLDCA